MAAPPKSEEKDQPKTHSELEAANRADRLQAVYDNLQDLAAVVATKLDSDELAKLNAMLTEMASLCPSQPTHAPMDVPPRQAPPHEPPPPAKS